MLTCPNCNEEVLQTWDWIDLGIEFTCSYCGEIVEIEYNPRDESSPTRLKKVNEEPLAEVSYVNLSKRESIKKNLLKASLFGAGLLALTGFANAQSIFYRSTNGTLTDLKSGGSGTPGGSSTQVQYNASGSFAGDSTFSFNSTSKVLEAKDIRVTTNGTVTRDANNYIQTVVLNGRTLTVTRDGNGFIQSVSDGTKTKTITRDGNNNVQSWSVS